MREMSFDELELVSGGAPSCGKDDPPPYGDEGGSGLGDWLKVFIIVSR